MIFVLYLLEFLDAKKKAYDYMTLSTDHSKVVGMVGKKIVVQDRSKFNHISDYKVRILGENGNFVFKYKDEQLCYITKSKKFRLCNKQKTKGTWELVKNDDFTYYLRQNGKCAALVSSIENLSDSSELTLKTCTNEDVIQITFMDSYGNILSIPTDSYAQQIFEDNKIEVKNEVIETVEKPVVRLTETVEKPVVRLTETVEKPVVRLTETVEKPVVKLAEKEVILPPTKSVIKKSVIDPPTSSVVAVTEKVTPIRQINTVKLPKSRTSVIQNEIKKVRTLKLDDQNTAENEVKANNSSNRSVSFERTPKSVITSVQHIEQVAVPHVSTSKKVLNVPSTLVQNPTSVVKVKEVAVPSDKVIVSEKRNVKVEPIQTTAEYEYKPFSDEIGENEHFQKTQKEFSGSIDDDLNSLSEYSLSQPKPTITTLPITTGQAYVATKPAVSSQASMTNCYMDGNGELHCHD